MPQKTFLAKDSDGNWNTIPPVPTDKINNVNCHKYILYALEKISFEEMISDPHTQSQDFDFTYSKKAGEISDALFVLVKSLKVLYALADKSTEIGKAYIGQILDAETNEMAHSFVMVREAESTYTCFDKQGFKYPFTVDELGTLLDFVNKDGVKSYHNQKWRFVPLN